MNTLLPTSTTDHDTQRAVREPSALDGATQVFIRRDARAPPLTRPYLGPFCVVNAHPKYFELDVNGQIDRVSVDRLKKAHIAQEESEMQCYDRTRAPDSPSESRDHVELPSERENTIPPQPLVRRGRPTREQADERRRALDAELRQAREQERERQDHYDAEFPPISTRFGRISRPPDRL